MPTLISVMSDYDMLSEDDQEKFKCVVLGRVVKTTTLNDAAAELRFKDDLVCPKCGCVHAVYDGKIDKEAVMVTDGLRPYSLY